MRIASTAETAGGTRVMCALVGGWMRAGAELHVDMFTLVQYEINHKDNMYQS